MGACHALRTKTLFRRQRVPYKAQKNPETAELIESGRVKVSVSSRAGQQRMWLKDLNSSQSHINTEDAGTLRAIWPELFL